MTHENFLEALELALNRTESELEQARQAGNFSLTCDLSTAKESLEVIRLELNGGPQRPRGQRSASFIRYVIDEEPRMVMDRELRDLVVQIEDVYDRY